MTDHLKQAGDEACTPRMLSDAAPGPAADWLAIMVKCRHVRKPPTSHNVPKGVIHRRMSDSRGSSRRTTTSPLVTASPRGVGSETRSRRRRIATQESGVVRVSEASSEVVTPYFCADLDDCRHRPRGMRNGGNGVGDRQGGPE
jgi:hypothetical protein